MRVFYGVRDSYNIRIVAAVIQHNTQQVLTEFHKNVCSNVPSTENLKRQRQIKTARTRESRKIGGKSKKFRKKRRNR